MQFAGASPGQINGFGDAGRLAGEYSYQAIQAALNGDWSLAAYLTQLAAEQTQLAQRFFMSTKIELTGLTILFEQGSHGSLHEPPVWNLIQTYCATN